MLWEALSANRFWKIEAYPKSCILWWRCWKHRLFKNDKPEWHSSQPDVCIRYDCSEVRYVRLKDSNKERNVSAKLRLQECSTSKTGYAVIHDKENVFERQDLTNHCAELPFLMQIRCDADLGTRVPWSTGLPQKLNVGDPTGVPWSIARDLVVRNDVGLLVRFCHAEFQLEVAKCIGIQTGSSRTKSQWISCHNTGCK